MDWYWAQYWDEPAAENVFGRESLKPRYDPLLRHWLQSGGRLSDFIRARDVCDCGRGIEQSALPSAHIWRED